MTDRTTRVRELNLYRQHLQLVAAGTKTIEPTRPPPSDQQLANIQTICGQGREALGTLAIEIEPLARDVGVSSQPLQK
ncbi:hypothetical protein ACFXOR_13425 [Streptomyces sp. NPDC059164]|uniref:hypothetical protein n=1 Tax=Streptomyces sp. NPDC059164 TaxID=3346750 RepID=UPI0036A49B39